MKRIKIYYVLRAVFSALACAALGAFVLWADAYATEVFDVLLVAMGVLAVAFNLPVLFLSLRAVMQKKSWEWINLVLSAVSICFGVCFALIPRTSPAIATLLICYIVLIPLFHIILAVEKGKQIHAELPKILFGGLLLVVSETKSEDTMFMLLGGGLILAAALYLTAKLCRMSKACRPYTDKIGK
ncbi:MAG: hypothetical protein J6U87_01940 [Clostridia bacterium]|nr:hypothetical protein [Clostridia bacterium]